MQKKLDPGFLTVEMLYYDSLVNLINLFMHYIEKWSNIL